MFCPVEIFLLWINFLFTSTPSPHDFPPMYTFGPLHLNQLWQELSDWTFVSLRLFAWLSKAAQDFGGAQSVLVEAGITHSFHAIDAEGPRCIGADEAEDQDRQRLSPSFYSSHSLWLPLSH